MDKVLLVLAIFLAIVLVALLGFKLYDYIVAFDFYNNSEVAFPTPGVNDSNFVPQGMDYIEELDTFLFTGYMSDDTASRVYVRRPDGTLTYTELIYGDGRPYNEHTGGIEHYGDYIFITGTTGIDVFSYADVITGKDKTVILGAMPTLVDPAHCYIYSDERGDYLLTGSFFIEEDYETPDHERIVTPAGDLNPSIILAYKLDKNGTLGFETGEPSALISVRRKVQGICFTDDGHMVISNSYSVNPSELFFYDMSKVTHEDNYHFAGTTKGGVQFDMELPIYYIDSDSHVGTVVAPAMSEELVFHDGKIYVFNESACNKYIFGKLTTGFNLYAYDYSALNK